MEILYKDQVVRIVFSSITGTFYGELIENNRHIVFQAPSLEQAIVAMQEAIDSSSEEIMDIC